MKTLSIYIKMIIYFLAISLLPMTAISILAYYKVSEVIRDDNQRMLSSFAIDAAYKIENELYHHIIETRAWASLPITVEGKRHEVTQLFDRLIATYPTYDLLLLLDESRKVMAINSVDHNGKRLNTKPYVGLPYTDGAWFTAKAEKEEYLSAYRRSDLLQTLYGTKGDCMNVSMPIRTENGKIKGYLVAYLSWARVQDVLDVVQVSLADDLSATVFMIEIDSYRLIAHRNTDLYGEQYMLEVDLRQQVQTSMAGTFEYNWPVLKTIGYAQVRLRERGFSLPWLVCIEVTNDAIYAQANFLRDLFLFITLLAAFCIVIIVYFISRRFTDPILKLVNGAQQIAQGNMRVEMPVDSVDEIGILANAFNQMSDALRERDEKLKQSNIELEEANRLKSEFLANMSHELRTPMNSIIGFTTLVLQRAGAQLPEQQRDNLAKVRKSALRLLDLLNSILDLSKIEAGSMEVDVDEFSLRGLVDMVFSTITPLIEGRSIALQVDVPGGNDIFMMQDRQKLQQIILNLMGNAVKFTQEGYIRAGFKEVTDPGLGTLSQENVDRWVRIWVEDTGIGIHEKDMQTIFSEFRQADGSSTRKFGGTGLGLSISKKLAKLLGGDILVKSEVGFGSTFTVVIPLRHKKAEPLVREESSHEMPSQNRIANQAGEDASAAGLSKSRRGDNEE